MIVVLHVWGHLPNMFKFFVQRLKNPEGCECVCVCVCVCVGGGLLWVNFCTVCSAGLSEPLPHCSLFCGHVIDPILVTLGKK